MFVRSVMQEQVTALQPGQSIQEAINLLESHQFDSVPVTDGTKVVGIVQLIDLYQACHGQADLGTALARPVSEVMVPQVITTTPNTPIEAAARQLHECDIPMLPVLEEGRLVGVLTEHDLFAVFSEMLGASSGAPRLILVSPEVKGRLARAAQVCAQAGVNILSAATYPSKVLDQQQILLRVETDQPRALAERLEAAGFRVLSVDE